MFLSLRARVIGLLLLSIPLALLAIGVSVYQYKAQIAHTERLSHAASVAATLDELFANVLQASNTSRRFVLSNEPVQLEAYENAVSAIPAVLKKIERLTNDQDEFTIEFETLSRLLKNKLAHLESFLNLHMQNDQPRLRALLISSDGLERLEAFRGSVAEFRSIGYALANYQLQQFRIGMFIQFAVVILLIISGGIWAVILGNETIRNILMPVSSMIAQVQRIASGNFKEMLPVTRRDEIGRLAEQINQMTERLHTTHEEREQAKADLAAEQQNLVDALQALDEGFASYDKNGCLVQCNEKFLEYFPAIASIAKRGVSYETLLRHRAENGSEVLPMNSTDDFINARLKDTETANSVRVCTLADGRVLQRSSYRTRNGGRVAVYVDITEIKRAETSLLELNRDLDERVQRRTDDLNIANEQLQRLNAEMGALIVSAPVAIIALSLDRKITTWNPAAIELTGLLIGEVNRGLTNLVHDENSAEFSEFLDRVYSGESPANAEFKLLHKDESIIEGNVSASVLSNNEGHSIGAILIIADLTEARALQQQFHQSQKLEVVAKLTAGLAHDFNNLLAIVISNIEMLEGRVPQDGTSENMLASAKKASLSGVALNKKLLAFSRGQSSTLEGLDLAAEISSLESLLQVTLGEQTRLEMSLDDNLWLVLADRSLLQSAALNLAVNARDAMSQDGKFIISASNIVLKAGENKSGLLGDYVQIDFTDTGEGMSEAVIAQAFQPFFTTKDFGKGSGLGLSMVYGFVKQSGGDVQIISNEGSGSQIKIVLPRAEIVSAHDTVQAGAFGQINGDGESILVVEDNKEMRRAMTLQLAELGFHPIEADGGAAALDLLKDEVPIDLMLTDIVMPGGMDGRELANEARALRSDLPIVFISGYPAVDDDGTEASWESLGIKVLAKPVMKDVLGAHINETIAKSGKRENSL